MAFDFSYMDSKANYATQTEDPLVKICNNSKKKSKNSYFFLNEAAVKLLNSDKVKVGIDIETTKIVIIPTNDPTGRKISRNPSGSATISVKNLIEENNLPTAEYRVGYHKNYAYGGIIFNYNEPING
jgi:hypothetical protein